MVIIYFVGGKSKKRFLGEKNILTIKNARGYNSSNMTQIKNAVTERVIAFGKAQRTGGGARPVRVGGR